MKPPAHEFRALVGSDGIARVVYVPAESKPSGVLCRSFWSHEAAAAADTYNREREEREALLAAGQGELF